MRDDSNVELKMAVISAVVACFTALLTNYGSHQLEVTRIFHAEANERAERQVEHAGPIWVAAHKHARKLSELDCEISYLSLMGPIAPDSQEVSLLSEEVKESKKSLDSTWTNHRFYLNGFSQHEIREHMRWLYYKSDLLENLILHWRFGSDQMTMADYPDSLMNEVDSLINVTRVSASLVEKRVYQQLEIR